MSHKTLVSYFNEIDTVLTQAWNDTVEMDSSNIKERVN